MTDSTRPLTLPEFTEKLIGKEATDKLRGRTHLMVALDDPGWFRAEDPHVEASRRILGDMLRNPATFRQCGKTQMVNNIFRYHYGKATGTWIEDEMTDHPTVLNPRLFDRAFHHVHRLFTAYLQAYQVYCDNVDAFVDPPLPWQKQHSRYQKRRYYSSTKWRAGCDWTDQNMDITYKKYLRAVKRLDPEMADLWKQHLAAWRLDHDRNLPHEPVRGPQGGAMYWCSPMVPARVYTPKPVPKNARERRLVKIANKKQR
jgi:hypothetical protein